jgi:hypothetical protein
MAESTEAFFADLATRDYEPILHLVTGIYLFDIADAGMWRVVVDHGKLSVTKLQADGGTVPQSDCTIACDRSEFDGLVQGRQNIMAAYLRGLIRGGGNVALALSFQRLFPGPSRVATTG